MTVDIEVTPEPEPAPADDAPDVVVVDTGDSDSSGDVELGITLGAVLEKVARLEAEIAELKLEHDIEDLGDSGGASAEEVAEVVSDVIEEALAEEEIEEIAPDTTPEKVHWAHRERGELFHRDNS